MVDKNEIKGGLKEAAGKVKSAVGKGTNDKSMEAEGDLQQASGKTEKNVGQIKDAVKRETR